MTIPIILGLTGRAGVGKTTAATYLESEWGVQPVGLAEPILSMLLALFNDANVPDGYATERVLKEQSTSLGYSYRHLAQTLGTQWGRDTLDAGLWRRIADAKVADIVRGGDHAVVTDIRYPDEAQWLRSIGGVLVRVVRPDTPPVRAHESESQCLALELDEHEVCNNDSLADLYGQLDGVMVRELRRQR